MASTAIVIEVSLASFPSERYAAWKMAVDDEAANLFTAFAPRGLFDTGITQSDIQWDINHPPQNGIHVARNIPIEPEEPAGNAGNVAVALYNNARAKITSFRQEVAKLKSAILVSIGATIREEISNPLTGFINVTVEMIMAHILAHYGTPTEADILRMFSSADAPISSEAMFHSEAVRMEATYRRLQEMGHDKPQVQRMEVLERASQHLVATTEAIKDYKRTHPILNTRSLAQMIEYVAIHAPNLRATVASTGYAGTAVGNTMTTQSAPTVGQDKIIEMAVTAGITAALAQLGFSAGRHPAAHGRQGPNHRTGRGGGRGAGRGAGRIGRGGQQSEDRREIVPSSYCFYHGYCGHSSQQCQIMLDDSRYALMRGATSPTSIPGFQGYSRNDN
jgi:hypothetical protein